MLILIPAILFVVETVGAGQAEYKISVDTSDQGPEISPTLYGIFFEDINHAVDGGIYAELIYNRAFEHNNHLEAWSIDRKLSKATVEIRDNEPLTEQNPHYLQVDIESEEEEVKVINSGHAGIPVEKGKKYDLALYINGEEFSSNLDIALLDSEEKNIGKTEIDVDKSGWEKYTAELEADKTSADSNLQITVSEPGKVNLGFVSLFPRETWQGRKNGLRPDMVEKLVELEPKFLRFPGGCLVGGKDLDNAYRWKETIGDITERPTKENLWGYHQSFGLGYYEYFLLAEDLDAEPVPMLNAGMSDIMFSESTEFVPLDEMDERIQDVLDLIEYANGPEDSEWGSKRAEQGHPEPFDLKYVGIGNEHWGEEYFTRFKMFQEAIKEEYPEIELVLSAGTQPDDQIFRDAWDFGREINVDIIEEHMYRPPEWFLRNTDRYEQNEGSGEPKTFVGEYAAHPEKESNNLQAALAEAAFMTGMEKNSDSVIMASYAPLFNKAHHSQWRPDLIWFNNTQVYGTPSYYVQQMFSKNQADLVLASEMSKVNEQNDAVISGQVGLGSWLTEVEYDELKVSSEGETLLKKDFSSSEVSGDIYQGKWTQKEGLLKQTSRETDTRIYFGEKNWDNYTIEVKARKLSGAEGMLIPFGVKDDDNFYWWNLGGWDNTQTAVEKSIEGEKMILGGGVPREIETGEWYDIKIEVSENRIKCYLNGQLIHDIVDNQQTKPLYHVASYDQKTGDIILKVINSEKNSKKSVIEFSGQKDVASLQEAEILSGANLEAENSFSEPQKVAPKKVNSEKIKLDNSKLTYDFPGYSVTILKFRSE